MFSILSLSNGYLSRFPVLSFPVPKENLLLKKKKGNKNVNKRIYCRLMPATVPGGKRNMKEQYYDVYKIWDNTGVFCGSITKTLFLGNIFIKKSNICKRWKAKTFWLSLPMIVCQVKNAFNFVCSCREQLPVKKTSKNN